MEMKNWSKALLSMYRYLEPLTRAIDRIVSSKSSISYYSRTNNSLADFDSIINLTERKVLYINIKLFIDQTMLSMNEKYSKLLILKYFENYNTESLCEVFGLIPRTMFRWHNVAVKEFSDRITSQFHHNPDLFNSMMNDDWIRSVYDYICSKSHSLTEYHKPKESTRDVFKILNSVILSTQRA